jgi:hypothetical protein
MHAGKWARALIFFLIPNLSGSDKAKEEKKNSRFNVFVYEGHNSWHTLKAKEKVLLSSKHVT